MEDQDLTPGEIRTSARTILAPLRSTQSLAVDPDSEPINIPQNAFLIINGNQVFPLTYSVVNIGRRVDNNLVLDDPSVSRVHVASEESGTP